METCIFRFAAPNPMLLFNVIILEIAYQYLHPFITEMTSLAYLTDLAVNCSNLTFARDHDLHLVYANENK